MKIGSGSQGVMSASLCDVIKEGLLRDPHILALGASRRLAVMAQGLTF